MMSKKDKQELYDSIIIKYPDLSDFCTGYTDAIGWAIGQPDKTILYDFNLRVEKAAKDRDYASYYNHGWIAGLKKVIGKE